MGSAEIIVSSPNNAPNFGVSNPDYSFTVSPWQVSEGQYYNQHRAITSDILPLPLPQELVDKVLDFPNMAWLQFSQRAIIKVRHPDRYPGDTPGPIGTVGDSQRPQRIELLYGQGFTAAPNLYVTAMSGTGVETATMDEIVKTGMVSPFMVNWLNRLAEPSRMHGGVRHLEPVLPLLEPHLRRKLIAQHYLRMPASHVLDNIVRAPQ